MLGLFLKADDAPVVIRLQDAEAFAGLRWRYFESGYGYVSAGLHMALQHLLVIHFVNMVAGKNEDVAGLFAADGINVLVHGIGGALVPMLRNAHLRRKNFDEISQAHQHGPAAANVAVEAERFVLR